jgi:Inner membrane protein YgaP-like, transmembrane domain
MLCFQHSEISMKANVGTIDRTFRILVGAALIVPAASGNIGLWGYIGAVPLLTGLFKYCPAYSLLGINSCGLKKGIAS